MKRSIGGDRLGSGAKMNVEMKNYSRSTHNLSQSWRSSMAPGVLYPFMVIPALNGDTFDIDLNAMAKTLPTNGPLMGSFKLQLDIFSCPVRLYQGILHNNALKLGLNMKNVKLPAIDLSTIYDRNSETYKTDQINPSCLLKYLGLSGIGENATTAGGMVKRRFSALPIIMYYDIFKNYYANKQEDNAYVISGYTQQGARLTKALIEYSDSGEYREYTNNDIFGQQINFGGNGLVEFWGNHLEAITASVDGTNYTLDQLASEMGTLTKLEGVWTLRISTSDTIEFINGTNYYPKENIKLKPFALSKIDEMRQHILSKNQLTDQVIIGYGASTYYDAPPFYELVATYGSGITNNKFNMNGLCVKTYQSDLFNNWVNTEWIDGVNGINEITKVSTAQGSFKIDALNLANKVYNMLNRIAISGGTYQDWQEAVFSQNVVGHAETPIYCGGMSGEIMFEEIASTAASADQPLGTLAGRGHYQHSKGGKIIVKVHEPSYIMGIVSITPRVDYINGNEWYMTDIQTMDDFHKPALDGIGFQNLIGEQMAWWDTLCDNNPTSVAARTAVGKVPAWINYMTAVDKAFGDFARTDGKNFMILSRDYTAQKDSAGRMRVTDFTTYIDPARYNYAFTDASLSAQNFWVQILSKVTARRVMSAKIIPNL